jgi:TMEM175 potassium channel family protein
MKTSRLEAFSDGVLAIIITIMVLELKVPEGDNLYSLLHKTPVFISYLISFIYIGIYWNNHHHLFQITEKVNGRILWANLHLLFWLSLIPFATAWIGENHHASAPYTLYGIVLLMCGIAFYILLGSILKHHEKDFALRQSIGKGIKDKLSLLIYLIGIILSFYSSLAATACYIGVAIIWIVPDKRVEKNYK